MEFCHLLALLMKVTEGKGKIECLCGYASLLRSLAYASRRSSKGSEMGRARSNVYMLARPVEGRQSAFSRLAYGTTRV